MGKMGIVVITKLIELRIKQDHARTPVSAVAGQSTHAKDGQQRAPPSVCAVLGAPVDGEGVDGRTSTVLSQRSRKGRLAFL